MPITHLGFLSLGLFDPKQPREGHELVLDLIELGERLGYDSAWVRQRHLETAVSSPLSLLAAATQRTERISLGTAVIPLGAENPFRLAEDLATIDVLSGGRLNPGFSVGTPQNWEYYREAQYPGTWQDEDLTHARAERLLGFLRDPEVVSGDLDGDWLATRTIEPHSPGLIDRVWGGAGSVRSARWAAEQGLNLLTSNVVQSDGGTDFAVAQAAVIREYLARHPDPARARVSQGLVVLPLDSTTPAQRDRYAAYARERDERIGRTFGPKQNLFAQDILGSADEIVERLRADEAFGLVREVAFALPFPFGREDYEQILHDIVERIAPALGWKRASAPA